MNITKTTNAAMAVALGIVPSYISRVRNGIRRPSRSPELIAKSAEYFSRLDLTHLQKKSIASLLSIDKYPDNQKDAEKLIFKWLSEKSVRIESTPKELKNLNNSESYKDTEIYYGISGKQKAVERFLTEVRDSGVKQTLLLFSDESIEWLTEPAFFIKWKILLKEVLEKGNKIKIIHTVARNSSEISSAIYGWLSLYPTGLIYPYYCQELRGTYRRTLFIAPKTAVITSQSFNENLDGVPNLYVTNHDAITAFTKEYNDFASICKPLMQRFIKINPAFISLLKECGKQKGDSYFFQPVISDIGYPLESAGDEFYHIICMKSQDKKKSCEYLSKILKRLKSDEHYHVLISSDTYEPYSMCLKESTGVFVIPTETLPVSFFFNEENLTKGFEIYLKKKAVNASITDRDSVIAEIENFINEN
ncbi:MAG: hypothetical protein Q4Q53_07385 [Methanocorpusculum sp.]|nr:hypothetical protein [Methanocorpusculum sp.]